MKKFKVTVFREDEYEVELDENVLDKDWMDNFNQYFFDMDTLEEHAEHLAQMKARFGGSFMEGYGHIMINGRKPIGINDGVNKGVNIKIVSEDENTDTDVYEIND